MLSVFVFCSDEFISERFYLDFVSLSQKICAISIGELRVVWRGWLIQRGRGNKGMLGGGSGAFSDVVVVFFRSKQIETDFMVDSFVFFIRAALTLPSTFFFCGEFVFKKQQK